MKSQHVLIMYLKINFTTCDFHDFAFKRGDFPPKIIETFKYFLNANLNLVSMLLQRVVLNSPSKAGPQAIPPATDSGHTKTTITVD